MELAAPVVHDTVRGEPGEERVEVTGVRGVENGLHGGIGLLCHLDAPVVATADLPIHEADGASGVAVFRATKLQEMANFGHSGPATVEYSEAFNLLIYLSPIDQEANRWRQGTHCTGPRAGGEK
ncbi:hypothetical protein GCM10027176_67580 [Actinoallomurus bryophytorum]